MSCGSRLFLLLCGDAAGGDQGLQPGEVNKSEEFGWILGNECC